MAEHESECDSRVHLGGGNLPQEDGEHPEADQDSKVASLEEEECEHKGSEALHDQLAHSELNALAARHFRFHFNNYKLNRVSQCIRRLYLN